MSSTTKQEDYTAKWETEPRVLRPLITLYGEWIKATPDLWPGKANLRILEPQAGHGNLVGALRGVFPDATIHAVELDPERAQVCAENNPSVKVTQGDFLTLESLGDPFHLIVGNPPYGIALDNGKGKIVVRDAVETHVRAAMKHLHPNGVLAYLLRNNWMVPQARDKLLAEFPLRAQICVQPRPSYSGGKGTDSVEYAWSVFSRHMLTSVDTPTIATYRRKWR